MGQLIFQFQNSFLNVLFLSIKEGSSINIKKNVEPSTDPCGTPLSNNSQAHWILFLTFPLNTSLITVKKIYILTPNLLAEQISLLLVRSLKVLSKFVADPYSIVPLLNPHWNQFQIASPGFPMLEELSLAGVEDDQTTTARSVDDDGIERILKNSTKLRLLDVRGCIKLTDSGLVKVPAWDLEHLFLSG